MSFQRVMYNAVFRRTSTFILAIMAGSFIFERSTDIVSKAIYDNINKGRQWKDIKHKYVKEE